MNKYNAKLSVGHKFTMGSVECEITTIDAFGWTPHYGFTFWTVADNGQRNFHAGWMPVELVDKFTGHFSPEKQNEMAVKN
jgi:hypothetical protein